MIELTFLRARFPWMWEEGGAETEDEAGTERGGERQETEDEADTSIGTIDTAIPKTVEPIDKVVLSHKPSSVRDANGYDRNNVGSSNPASMIASFNRDGSLFNAAENTTS